MTGGTARPARLGCLLLAGWAGLASAARADDWPQWLGPRRDGVWRETGIVTNLPAGGLRVRWRVPVGKGYCGPAVADGRVFLMDRAAGRTPERKRGEKATPAVPGQERVVCFDAKDGSLLWEHIYDCPYRIEYPSGPRATPVVAGGRVFTLGAMGDLRCLETANGHLVWSVQFSSRYAAEPPFWGWASHPLLDGNRLICLVGGTNSAVVAFDKDTGRELWRNLTTQEIGYAPPMIFEVRGRRHLVVWHPEGVVGLEPETGRVLWTHAYPVDAKPQRPEITIATPRCDGRRLFLTQYYKGSLMLDLGGAPEEVRICWNRHGKIGVDTADGLHTVMSTPLMRSDALYGLCGNGELRCLDIEKGDRLWENLSVVGGKEASLANVFLIDQGDRTWIWTDQGELVLARLTRTGYEELDRTRLLATQEHTRGRDVLWCHPAFAQRCLFVHNSKELICVSLAQE